MKVWNKRDPSTPKDAVYVGRPSKWGNTYSHLPNTKAIHTVASREVAIERFRDDLLCRRETDPDWFFTFIKPLRGKDLVCWCAPLPCHADILMELANV